jgi:predicted house-cleaning noncanonical NTP pyrophosphatase (MazG superfamily)
MPHWMNRHLGKISLTNLLRAPADMSNGGGSGGADDNGAGDDNNESDDDSLGGVFGGGDDEGDSEDIDLSVVLGESTNPDDLAFNFADSEYQQSAAEELASKELGETIKSHLSSFKLDDEDFPENLDFSDRNSVKEFMTNTNRKLLASALNMIVPVIRHAQTVSQNQMRHQMENNMNKSSATARATDAFKQLGLSEADVPVGKMFFQRAMQVHKGNYSKAAVATRKAMQAMGRPVGNSSKQDKAGKTTLEGTAALDDIFGSMR